MSVFGQADLLLSGAIDDQFGERLRIEPLAVGNYGAGPDPSRVPIEAVGVLHEGPSETRFLSGDRQGERIQGRISEQEAWVSFDRGAVAASPPRKGDHLVSIDRTPQRRFVIGDSIDDGPARVAFRLVGA